MRPLLLLLTALTIGCTEGPSLDAPPPRSLAAWGLFDGPLKEQRPAPGVRPYAVRSPLFSDYTRKRRFLRLPEGESIRVAEDGSLRFPAGAVLVKTFSMPADLRQPEGEERLLETRLLVRGAEGWRGLTYLYDAEQGAASLESVGDMIELEWTHTDGRRRSHTYVVPTVNDCKRCHAQGGALEPLGPSLAQLSGEQLAAWREAGVIEAAAPERALARWSDESVALEARARSYLHSNCAHCHNPRGHGSNAGIDLRLAVEDRALLGVGKAPVAAGRGSGGLSYDIVPGKPEQSILYHRMASTEPEVAMPEIGRGLVHDEGLALIGAWIKGMKAPARD